MGIDKTVIPKLELIDAMKQEKKTFAVLTDETFIVKLIFINYFRYFCVFSGV